jgi:ADP-ribosylglycohydrolase
MDRLLDRFLGCIAGSRIGSSMAMSTEHMPIETIDETFGFLTEMRPTTQNEKVFRWTHGPQTRKNHYDFVAGSTEDGIERQKLIVDAIVNKKGPINVQDLAQSWLRNIRDEHFGYALHWSDKPYYEMLKAGVHPSYIGLFSLWPAIVTMARSCHPIGLINAGDPARAAEDIYSLGAIYHQAHGSGVQTAAAYAAGIAEALDPNATVDSVLQATLAYVDPLVGDELRRVYDIALTDADITSVRRQINDRFTQMYGEQKSSGEEVVSRGIAIFIKTNGDPKDSILHGVNFGRDTDCTAAIAAGLSGAFSGAQNIPQEWIDTVDEATKVNSAITVCQRTIMETAQNLYDAFVCHLKSRQTQLDLFSEITATWKR